ncbi:peptidase S11 D-alanyl-D-alanine carboxypeptidase 1 [Alkalidesulfovibrio alkalitolerans DSM 16529]|uniref:Peptidase S11 D-alanyl-D-alanine carboxypeptidase 1 n=1 Tax=Alkalidesulfovibrio alkalitolerans DSM 16529 TaxID=1121439 RepID=S7T6U1_9BACT|nr:D-alanyl-D-alanine carboxypeptidase family protein [Alkalidesulfovibrio alkalitolerans]EPR32797.1 peptidase S11 D-alanyl-D-alanine carboxypeptidase 1 [Alkalidesulfovibrio alkalitolerans DSM 16529]
MPDTRDRTGFAAAMGGILRPASWAAFVLVLIVILPGIVGAAATPPGQTAGHAAVGEDDGACRIAAGSAVLLDAATGRTLFQQDPDKSIPPASLAKVMAMFVVLDAVRAGLVSLDDEVVISAEAAATGGSRMHLKEGETVTLDNLLRGMAVSSGNDAAMAAAEHVGVSVAAFVAAMNAKAALLGMERTVFVNPTGLPAKGQTTTAHDMAVMTREYLRAHPKALDYHSQTRLVHNGVRTRNKNPLLDACEGADGLKTGWIRASGYNLITTVKRGETRLVGVILGAKTPDMRSRENLRLMEAGFTALEHSLTVNEALPQVAVPEPAPPPAAKKAPASKKSVAKPAPKQAAPKKAESRVVAEISDKRLTVVSDVPKSGASVKPAVKKADPKPAAKKSESKKSDPKKAAQAKAQPAAKKAEKKPAAQTAAKVAKAEAAGKKPTQKAESKAMSAPKKPTQKTDPKTTAKAESAQ